MRLQTSPRRFGASLAIPGLVLAVWFLLSAASFVDDYLLPSPAVVFRAALELLDDGELLGHLATSFGRVLMGFSLAAAIGVPLGIIVGMSRYARAVVDPFARFLMQIPPIAWIPLFILWFGIGEGSKSAIIIYATLFPIMLNTTLGVLTVDPKLLEVGRAFCLSPLQLFYRVIVPWSVPSIFTGLRLGLGNSWRALVAAEMIAASKGLGFMIMDARSLARPDIVLVGIFTIGAVGLLIDSLVAFLEGTLTPWRKDEYHGRQ